MIMLVLFIRQIALTPWVASMRWFHWHNSAVLAIGSFVQLLEKSSTAILVVSAALGSVVLEWLT
jgi:hypothetical protein